MFQEIYQRQSFQFKIIFSSSLLLFSLAGLWFADWLEKKLPAPEKIKTGATVAAEEEEWILAQTDVKAKLLKELEEEEVMRKGQIKSV